MIWSGLVRILRKRIVLGTIFSVSFLYCFASFFREFQQGHVVESDVTPKLRPDFAFRWHLDLDSNETNNIVNCRNSVQGKLLITDDQGYICLRADILPTGCCNREISTTKRYSCLTCRSNYCCSVYEYCISCCLHPDKKVLLQTILGKAAETFNVLFSSVTDHFELCLAKCRTSSQSVQHENSYRDPKSKHCYGDSPPLIQPAVK